MSDSTIAKRYAKAVFDLAAGKKLLEKVMSDLYAITKLLEDFEQLRAAFASPVLSKNAQSAIMTEILKKIKVQAITAQFIQVLVNNGRFASLVDIVDAYEDMLKISKGEVVARVTTASPLTKSRIASLEKDIGKRLGKKVQVESVVDEAILGGMIVKIGSKMLDASVLGGLEKLQTISKNAIASC